MTSSNVSNMVAGLQDASLQLDSVVKTTEIKLDGGFSKALADVTNSRMDSQPVNTSYDVSSVNLSTNSSKETYVDKSSRVTASDTNSDTDNEADIEQISEKVEKFASDVKEVIEDELDVTDEEVTEAMETLGLTAIDLLQPQNLVQLISELTESTDSINLLMSDGVGNIFDQVAELANSLLDEMSDASISITDLQIYMDTEEVTQVDVRTEDLTDVITANENLISQTETAEVSTEENAEIPVLTETKENVVKQEASDVIESEKTEDTDEITVNLTTQTKNDSRNTDDNQSDFNSNPFKQKLENDSNVAVKGNETQFIDQPRFEITYSPENETVSLPTGESVEVSEMIDQIVEQAKVLNTEDATTMEMTLNPEGLGKIFMEVTQKGDEITARLFTENEAVKSALESQMANLRTELNSSSNKITSIEVTVGSHEFERNLEEEAKGDQQREEQQDSYRPKTRSINLSNLDELSGLMSEEEQLVAQIMRENGNTLDYQA